VTVSARTGDLDPRTPVIVGAGQSSERLGEPGFSTIENEARADKADRPDFTEHADGSLEDRGYGLKGLVSSQLAAHGLTDAPSQYALIDNARRGRLKQRRGDYAAGLGALFAPFTKVAAANPHASAPVERTAAELVTPTEANRPIADPYTRYTVAREKVNQGAAVLLMSVAAARRLGVPTGRWVFLHGHADLRERDLLDRGDLSRGPASVMAARHALEVAGIKADDLATIDLYSCFAAPVLNICEGLGEGEAARVVGQDMTHRSSAVDELVTSEDMIEGVTAFAAKRTPRWRNRWRTVQRLRSRRGLPSAPRPLWPLQNGWWLRVQRRLHHPVPSPARRKEVA